jgi:NADPH:quinone reductase-like Zn-dependent oxidoreductase
MKASRFHTHGPPEVLQYEDAPDPVPRAGRAIVRVRACALNHLDLWERRGIERVRIPLPHISGSDVAGEVADAGGGPVPEGTRVMVQPGLSCGVCPACLEGRHNFCATFDVLGLQSDGGYAELVSVPVENLVPIPDHVDFILAAAFPLTFLTAWHMLVTLGRVRAGDVVLVLAGGSGVGQAAMQIARLYGARVLATSNPKKMEQTRALGASDVFDHYSGDFAAQARAATNGRGVDIVVEHVGEATWATSLAVARAAGRVVVCGATTGANPPAQLHRVWWKQLTIVGSTMGARADFEAAYELVRSGRAKPVIDRVYPLEEIREAHARLEAGEQLGKIVLTID